MLRHRLSEGDIHLVNMIVASRSRSRGARDDGEWIGAAGEVGFARIFDLPPPDPTYSVRSDGGVDFRLSDETTVDVKTIDGDWRIKHLMVPLRVRAGVYVLLHYDPEDKAVTGIGWTTGGVASTKHVAYQHYNVPSKELWPVAGLLARHQRSLS